MSRLVEVYGKALNQIIEMYSRLDADAVAQNLGRRRMPQERIGEYAMITLEVQLENRDGKIAAAAT